MRTGQQQKPGNMFMASGVYAPDQPLAVKPGTLENHAHVNDPYYEELYASIGCDMIKDPENFYRMNREAAIYQIQSAWGIWLPRAHVYDLWWPWLKEYNGVSMTGWAGIWDWIKYLWIDHDLKESMGH
jgi:hypothetical protein